jgi:catechol 2,3-dioxygenase-like lactoylglutathione lyase family enzyme
MLEPKEMLMIDHIGFAVSDYARAKAFYAKALAPLG